MPINPKVKKGESREEYKKRLVDETRAEIASRRAMMVKGELQLVMDVDDLGFLLSGYDDLMRLKKSLPNLKITAFTIPLSSSFMNSENAKHFKWEGYRKWAKIINELDWVEVAAHGFAHVHNECDIDYNKAIVLLKAVENLFKRVDLEHIKLFKAPYWQMSYDFLVACRDRDWTVAIDKNHMRPVPEGLKTYLYNWSFEEPLPLDKPIIKGHGHFYGNNQNNIADSMDNILSQIPSEAQFKFVSEYLKENGDDTKIIDRIYTKET